MQTLEIIGPLHMIMTLNIDFVAEILEIAQVVRLPYAHRIHFVVSSAMVYEKIAWVREVLFRPPA